MVPYFLFHFPSYVFIVVLRVNPHVQKRVLCKTETLFFWFVKPCQFPFLVCSGEKHSGRSYSMQKPENLRETLDFPCTCKIGEVQTKYCSVSVALLHPTCVLVFECMCMFTCISCHPFAVVLLFSVCWVWLVNAVRNHF